MDISMHVFVTGATGWVGSAVVKDLMDAGHRVTGLARSDAKAGQLVSAGAAVLRGTLDDLGTLYTAAAAADAVIHMAFDHDFSRFIESCEQDRRAIETLGEALRGSSRPMLVTSGLLGLPSGASEMDRPDPTRMRKTESAARALAERGVRVATVRLAPSVHGIGDRGFIPFLLRVARRRGVSAFIGKGTNAWSAVHRQDAARVYRLALEQGVTEPVYHAVSEQTLPFKEIAQAIGKCLDLPVVSRDSSYFGWFAGFAAADMSVTSAHTQMQLGWQPSGTTLFAELDSPLYRDEAVRKS